MLKKLVIIGSCVLLLSSLCYAATLQRGKTFTTNETVTADKLHSLVDDATLSDIDQTDIGANYGLGVKSSSTPTDTDMIWNDTSAGTVKAYIGGAWTEISGNVVGNLAVTGTSTLTDTVTCSDDVIIGTNVTIGNNLSVTGKITNDAVVKGWINFDGTGTISINSSYNVSSIADDGTGRYTITWDTDFADTNYVVVGSAFLTGQTMVFTRDTSTPLTTGTAVIGTAVSNTGTHTDAPVIMAIAIGNQ